MFTWKFKMAAIFVKLYMSLPIHICIDLSNQLRIYRDSIFLKLFVIPGGNALPKKIQQGDFSATLPNRSGMCQGTSPTTWLNFYTPCKSQPTSLPYYSILRALVPVTGIIATRFSGDLSDANGFSSTKLTRGVYVDEQFSISSFGPRLSMVKQRTPTSQWANSK